MRAEIRPAQPKGSARAPASKSMAHRQLICAALAEGESRVRCVGDSVDIHATVGALRALGAAVNIEGDTALVHGVHGALQTPAAPVDCCESGSTLRFVVPLFALGEKPVRLAGAPRLFQRPLDAYAGIFAGQALPFAADKNGLTLQGPLRPGDYALRGDVSSQFVSGLLFALPLLAKDSCIRITTPLESRSYIELTRAAQAAYGVHSEWEATRTLRVPGGQRYTAKDTPVEGDWSGGAALCVLAAVRGGFGIENLDANSAQGDAVVLDILRRCGAEMDWRGSVLYISPPAEGLASPGRVSLADCPDLGPVLTALALFCQGETTFVDAGRLRIKESDRIAAVEAEFAKLGAHITSGEDWYTVRGGNALHTAVVDSHNDHRLVMALSVAALAARLPLTITDAGAVGKSWPAYFTELQRLGIEVETHA